MKTCRMLIWRTTNVHPVDPDSELRKHPYCTFWRFIQLFYLECLKRTWRSPIYSFFKTDKVSVQYHNGWLCHFFPCAAWKCKTVAGGVCRFQDCRPGFDSKSSTSCTPVLLRRGSTQWYKGFGQQWNERFDLFCICPPGPEACMPFSLITY